METQMPDMPDHACAQVLAMRPVLEQIANNWSMLILTRVCTEPPVSTRSSDAWVVLPTRH